VKLQKIYDFRNMVYTHGRAPVWHAHAHVSAKFLVCVVLEAHGLAPRRARLCTLPRLKKNLLKGSVFRCFRSYTL